MSSLNLSSWYRFISTANQMPCVVFLKTFCFHLKWPSKHSTSNYCAAEKPFKCTAACLCRGWGRAGSLPSHVYCLPRGWGVCWAGDTSWHRASTCPSCGAGHSRTTCLAAACTSVIFVFQKGNEGSWWMQYPRALGHHWGQIRGIRSRTTALPI